MTTWIIEEKKVYGTRLPLEVKLPPGSIILEMRRVYPVHRADHTLITYACPKLK